MAGINLPDGERGSEYGGLAHRPARNVVCPGAFYFMCARRIISDPTAVELFAGRHLYG